MDSFNKKIPSTHFKINCAEDTNSPNAIKSLKKKNDELNNDITVLKKLVYMLNVELELRESKNGASSVSSNVRCAKDYLTSQNIRHIEPLLRAFEESKNEKDELLTKYKRSFDEVSNRCKEIVFENSFLRQQLHEFREKAESNLMEWKKLHENFILTEEHNQLLARQVKLLQNKHGSMEKIHQEKLKQSDVELNELKEKFEASKAELCLLKGKMSVLSEMKKVSPLENRLEKDDYSSFVIIELKKLSADLRLHHTKEIQSLKTKLKTLESSKCDLEVKFASVSSERDHLLGYTSAMKSETRQINSKLKMLENELQVTKKNENDARLQLMKSMGFIRELVSSQNSKIPCKATSTHENLTSDHSD